MLHKNHKQSGRSMIEMLGVLAIVGILSAGGIAGYSMAMQNHKTNALIEKVQIIAQRVRELYDGEYTVLNKSTNQINNLINAGFINDGDSPFGGKLRLRKSKLYDEMFVIETTETNIPADACVKIATAYWGSSGVLDCIFIDEKGFCYSANNYPITKGRAITECDGGNKMIHWRFK